MKVLRLGLVVAGLIWLLVLLPETASGRVYFHIGLGVPFSHYYSGFYGPWHSHYGWHGGYYRWLGGYGYRRHCFFGPRHFWWRRPVCSSGVSIWIDDWYPAVVGVPIVVEAPKVITQENLIIEQGECGYNPKYDDSTAKLFERLRRQKSKLLKILRIGDKEKRIEAIRDLAGFSFDDRVREALEDVLLSDPDPDLRRQVAESLGKTTNRNVLAALQQAKADDPEREVRQEAYRAIVKIKGY